MISLNYVVGTMSYILITLTNRNNCNTDTRIESKYLSKDIKSNFCLATTNYLDMIIILYNDHIILMNHF